LDAGVSIADPSAPRTECHERTTMTGPMSRTVSLQEWFTQARAHAGEDMQEGFNLMIGRPAGRRARHRSRQPLPANTASKVRQPRQPRDVDGDPPPGILSARRGTRQSWEAWPSGRGWQLAPVGVEPASSSPVPTADRPSPWSGTVSRSSAHRPELAVALLARISSRHEPTIASRTADDTRQHARQRRAVAQRVLLAVPSPGGPQRGHLARSLASAIVRPAHGLHPVRHHRCRRPAELA
jgi:hypothetical protein